MNEPREPVKAPSPDARAGRWRRHRALRRQELIEAAVEAIRRHGPDLGMDDIAAEAGVSKPVLYRYFADKAALHLAIGQAAADALLERMAPVLARAADSRESVAAIIDAYLGHIESEPDLYQFVMHRLIVEAGRTDPAKDPVAGYRALVGSGLARVIGDRLRELGLDSGPAEPWGHGLVGLVEAAGDWWLRSRQPIGRGALTEYLTSLIWSGFAGIRAAADLPGGLGMLGAGSGADSKDVRPSL